MGNATIIPSHQAYVDTTHYDVSNGHTIAEMNDIVRNISIALEDVFHWIAGDCRKEVTSHNRVTHRCVDV